jgi:hypothetical protein
MARSAVTGALRKPAAKSAAAASEKSSSGFDQKQHRSCDNFLHVLSIYPESDSFNHATIGNRVFSVGRQIEAETKADISERAVAGKTADHMVVGIDGAFVVATRSRTQRRHFEVVLGRIEAPDCKGDVFAAVRDLDDFARERVRSALRRAGRGPTTKLIILSDGEDATPRMPGDWLKGNLEHRLDWFHLNRRIKWLWNAVYNTLGLGDHDAETRFRRYGRALKSVRWNLWHHGRSWHARWMIPISRLAALILSHRLETEAAGQSTARIDELYRKFQEFQGYVLSQHRLLGRLRGPLAQRRTSIDRPCRVDCEPACQSTHVQEAADALVAAGSPTHAQRANSADQRQA